MNAINLGLSKHVLTTVNDPSKSLFKQLNVEENFSSIVLILNGSLGLKYWNEKDLKSGSEAIVQEIQQISKLINDEMENNY